MEYCYDQYLEDTTWSRTEGNDDMIGYTVVVSVSISWSRCSDLAFSSYTMTQVPYGLYTVLSFLTSIYSIDTLLYPYTLPAILSPYFFSSLCLSAT